MEKLWISNIAAGTSDEELVALVKKYAPDLECLDVHRIDGGGTRPGALLSFSRWNLDPASGAAPASITDAVVAVLGSLENLSRRLNGLYWKGSTLSSSVLIEPTH